MGHYINFINLIPISVLTASLIGSPHCTAMCGGLVMSMTHSKKDWWLYQFARLLGYLALGALGGMIGKALFTSEVASEFSWIFTWLATAIIGGGLIYSGTRLIFKKAIHFNLIPQAILNSLFKLSQGRAWLTGFFSALLPCGWLHTFVIAAIASASPAKGGAVLLFFWLGTLPALATAPFIKFVASRMGFFSSSRLAGVLLLLAGVGSLSIKIYPSLRSADHAVHSCHENP